jgi:hypothetical protein
MQQCMAFSVPENVPSNDLAETIALSNRQKPPDLPMCGTDPVV